MIANSGHDERGRYTGGQAGDQTGTEWEIRSWYKYSSGWSCVLRYPDTKVASKIAELAKKSANNNNIGYNQANRTSFWFALKDANYDPSKISKKCDADCSAGVSAIVKAVGYLLNIQSLKDIAITNYTGSMKPNFKVAGFEVLTAEKYLTSDKFLMPGDIILNERHHTCINLDYGSGVKASYEEGWVQDGKGWWYRYADGSYPKSCWKTIKGKDYYFKADGYMASDEYIKSVEYSTNGKLYYVDKEGAWDVKIYKWEQDSKGWWIACLKSSNYMKNSWAKVDNKWYYFNSKGYMVTGTKTIDGKIYSFRKDGSLVE